MVQAVMWFKAVGGYCRRPHDDPWQGQNTSTLSLIETPNYYFTTLLWHYYALIKLVHTISSVYCVTMVTHYWLLICAVPLDFVLNLVVRMQTMPQDLKHRCSSGIKGGGECLLVFRILCQCGNAKPARQMICYTNNQEPLDHGMSCFSKCRLIRSFIFLLVCLFLWWRFAHILALDYEGDTFTIHPKTPSPTLIIGLFIGFPIPN
jgi:hypothetical protein